ncbi:C-type lectin domain family 2 member D isoform X2 [Arapaima gigas]
MNIKFCQIYRNGEAGGKQAEEPRYQEDLLKKIRVYQWLSFLLLLLTVILAAVIIALSLRVQPKPTCAKAALGLKSQCTPELCNNLYLGAEKNEPEKELGCLKGCADGWLKFKDSCFFFSQKRDTWSRGREQCQKWGADLAVIDNGQVQEFLSKKGTLMYWMGLNRSSTGEWVWINQARLGRSYWAPGADQGNCAFLIGKDEPLKSWSSTNCSHLTAYICQKNA